eukprot:gene1640-biopygen1382
MPHGDLIPACGWTTPAALLLLMSSPLPGLPPRVCVGWVCDPFPAVFEEEAIERAPSVVETSERIITGELMAGGKTVLEMMGGAVPWLIASTVGTLPVVEKRGDVWYTEYGYTCGHHSCGCGFGSEGRCCCCCGGGSCLKCGR